MLSIRNRNKFYEQSKVAKALRQGITRLISQKMRSGKFGDSSPEDWQALAATIALGAEGFEPVFKAVAAPEVNRRGSMMTGPFFTSGRFPVPTTASGAVMLAMAQLDLDDFSAAARDDLGDGLLQWWFDTEAEEALMRVIPWQEAQGAELTAFDERAADLSAFDAYPLPSYWADRFCGPLVQTIVALKSRGFQSQASTIEALCWNLGEDISEWLRVLVNLYAEKAPHTLRGPVGVLGTFYSIEYSAHEVGMRCLLDVADWGSSGGAQIFYRPQSPGRAAQFEFWNCVR